MQIHYSGCTDFLPDFVVVRSLRVHFRGNVLEGRKLIMRTGTGVGGILIQSHPSQVSQRILPKGKKWSSYVRLTGHCPDDVDGIHLSI
jgi:hypothetical protein